MKKSLTTLLAAVALVAAYFYEHSANSSAVSVPESVEIPQTAFDSDPIIAHTGYTLAYNLATNCPRWVAWGLTAEEVAGDAAQRTDDFRPDDRLPAANRVGGDDYKRSGYDRGHLCPAADMKWSAEAMSDCFFMSNICPQVPALNQKWWEHTERACRRWAAKEDEIYICCGPIYRSGKAAKYIGRDVRVQVPDAFFKVVLSLSPGREKAIAFLYENIADRQTMEQAATTVDRVESLTGYDFFPGLDDALEDRLEASADLRAWD